LSEKGLGKKAELLRKETSLLTGKEITQREWFEENILLLKSHVFFTSYGRQACNRTGGELQESQKEM
jgi:hypothetical protein